MPTWIEVMAQFDQAFLMFWMVISNAFIIIYKHHCMFITKDMESLRTPAILPVCSMNLNSVVFVQYVVGFWKEVKALNRTNTSLPGVIEGVSGGNNIHELWRQYYSALLTVSRMTPTKWVVSPTRIHLNYFQWSTSSVKQLAYNKTSGSCKQGFWQLNECKTGCMTGNTLVNHLWSTIMYADDLAFLSLLSVLAESLYYQGHPFASISYHD